MSDNQQRQENNSKVAFVISVAAGENKDAAEYLSLLSKTARIADDIFDQDQALTQNDLLFLVEALFIRIPSNKFYKQNQEALLSQHITIWNAWEISNVLANGDNTDQIYAHVLRDYINECLPLVALLTQGHDKMKEVNGLIRSLFKKELGE